MSEIILLGDSVVYRDDIKGFDSIGTVIQTGSSLKVQWDGEDHSRVEIYDRLRLARLNEVDANHRLINFNDI